MNGIYNTYFFHPLTNNGGNTPREIQDNLLSLECIVRDAVQRCPQIRPVLPQTEWACLIGHPEVPYEKAILWCKDRLETCDLGYWPQKGEGPLAGEILHPTRGVLLEVVWAREMQAKEELGLFTELDAMAQWCSDLEQNTNTED